MIALSKASAFTCLLLVLLQCTSIKLYAIEEQRTQKVRRIAIIETMTLTHIQNSTNAYIEAIQLLFPDDKIQFQRMNAEGNYTRALALVDALATANIQPDLLITVATLATKAAFKKQNDITFPTVFMSVADPISEGIIESFGKTSKANITGNSHVISSDKKLEFLTRIIKPDSSRTSNVAIISTDYPSTIREVAELIENSHTLNALAFFHLEFPYSPSALKNMSTQTEVLKHLTNLNKPIIGYWSPNGPLGPDDTLRENIYNKFNIPQLYVEDIEAIKNGALIGIFPETSHIGQSAAKLSARILNGEAANSIPVDRLKNFTVAVNVSTAVEFNLPIPSDLLQMAQEHVYH